MSQDKELEIQMQFLEEATDYLNTLEAVLLEIDTSHRIDLEKINGALRAAHSIKGGAAMMGFRVLSDLAHRLEDAFKVLKTRKSSLEIDQQLQSLLLSAIDWMRQIVELLSTQSAIEEEWLTSFCYPVFDELYQRLGDPTPEDATTMLSPEDGQNIIPLLFETEVEGCLQRLEAVLADSQQPCLQEEVAIMAAELGGLGEMLQLSAFSQLCDSIKQTIESAAPERISDIAQIALQTWRRSQALVLTNQLDSLPRAIELSEIPTTSTTYNQTAPLSTADAIAQFLATDNGVHPEIELVEIPVIHQEIEIAASNFVPVEADIHPVNLPEINNIIAEHKTELIAPSKDREHSENTVRVPSKQLEQINDLFSELIVQRNGLHSQLEKLRKLSRNLGQRVQNLDRENQELRMAYNRVISASIRQNNSSEIDTQHSVLTTQPLSTTHHSLEEIHLRSQDIAETIVQVQEVSTDIQLSADDADLIARKLNKTSKQLQTKLNQVRMRPISELVERFPRAIRDLNVEYGKNVQLKIEGGNTLIERSILEALNDPLMHLLRNAFDHGIEEPATRHHLGKPEQGLIEIHATHRSNRTIISMRDDGRGISLEKIRSRALAMGLDSSLLESASDDELLSLIFEPGFSTSETVTALSGRGVGMDVVRNNLKLVRGDITVDTEPGVGTTFTLSVPFTLSVARVLLVETGKILLAFPTDVISEVFLLQSDRIISMGGSEVINWQGTMLPLIRLGQYLEFNCPRYDSPELETPAAINANSVLIVKGNNQTVAIQVDRCWGEQEVAIRQVEGNIPLPEGFSNCTILGDGRVVALVSANELLYWIATNQNTPKNNQLPSVRLKTPFLFVDSEKLAALPPKPKGKILIIDDSINVRRFLALTLEKGGYQVEQAKDGQDALEKLETGLQIAAVICDIEMPRLDGYGFLGKVKNNGDLKNIPVAMLTSRSSDKHRRMAMQLGARAYFSKPYNEQELLRTLEQLIGNIAESAASN
ncbi:hybrid sensor histidine kinase/response regulator [Nostoc sp. FACHB-87]|uniref:hybrid sensor histidine kinase/response regulator n=1 Tax=Nostocales TaxID=1161 RepID=UPI00168892C9|nr:MULTISPECIES: hybrid sensor histidine kinase/response regulator [Nostocales]MBD2299750.1 hybrid sensor histidine kinase/response regulator [Nostoc sp. FACHB-190]MBD2456880.1 hybrid sensor histidine kinase/response regulator [Nostoc sp. FACHB-87]MBD2478110.1 hybrid sensor histidine kinase/response regulator [Anabaena sp. FACHB-83]MBD2489968.1 hybrid sensor histidine kinase/response regulator [Aulosira sp. FACHB-615]